MIYLNKSEHTDARRNTYRGRGEVMYVMLAGTWQRDGILHGR